MLTITIIEITVKRIWAILILYNRIKPTIKLKVRRF